MVRDLFVNIASALKIPRLILALRKPTPRIIFYHGVSKDACPVITPENVGADQFEEHLNFYLKRFDIVSLSEFENRWRSGTLTNKEIVITFDDGYANNLYIAQPILQKYNCPYTVFVCTEHIETGSYFPTSIARLMIYASNLNEIKIPSIDKTLSIATDDDKKRTGEALSRMIKTMPLEKVKVLCNELINNISLDDWDVITEKYSSLRPMSWSEVERLANDPLCTIGSHCRDHICCHYNQKKDILVDQITNSKKIIEEKLSKPCDYLAYPNGDFTPEVCSITEKAGYNMALTTKSKERLKLNTNMMSVPRIGVPREFKKFVIYISMFPSI